MKCTGHCHGYHLWFLSFIYSSTLPITVSFLSVLEFQVYLFFTIVDKRALKTVVSEHYG